jgi:hypothetical protein
VKGSFLKAAFLLVAFGVAGFCAYKADNFDQEAHRYSEEISVTRSRYVGDATGNAADKIVKPLEDDRDRLVKKSDEMYHLFTYMISGFLGLAISAASILLGLPRQEDNKSGGSSGQ